MNRILRIIATAGVLAFCGARAPGAEPTGTAAIPGTPGTEVSASLPLTDVVLYSSGVGFFEREGQVEGDARIDLNFKTENINDLLKSMVVQDLDGGQVRAVTYGSRDPLAKTLKSFGLDLTANPSLGDLLNQARGEPIEVFWPNLVTGTIIGVEDRIKPAGDNKTVKVAYLNLLTAEGLQSIPLEQTQRIQLLNPRLNQELRQALESLANGHDTQKKSVSLAFHGNGKRRVSVAYIAQTPVWKTSYRLVLDEKQPAFVQGWAVVENTSDEDWQNVHLSLISGRPISFVMDMYQPLYTSRPFVEPELYASLRPQVYGDRIAGAEERERAVALNLPTPAMQPAAPGARANSFGGGFGGGGGMAAGGPIRKEAMFAARGLGVQAGAAASSDMLSEKLSREIQNSGVVSAAQGLQTGELFQYAIKAPVTLARQKSAMLPILNDKIEGQKVSIYNERVLAKNPLNGFRLKNTTDLHLMQGPITVFENGTYAGDARIEDMAPKQDRLISYAIDLETEVEPDNGEGKQELVSVKIKKGTLVALRKFTQEKIYRVKNRGKKAKTVLIEHPYQSDWKLIEPAEPKERSRDVYRFAVDVGSGKSDKLRILQEQQTSEAIELTGGLTPDQITYYLRAQKISQRIKSALEKVASMHDKINQTAGERTRHEQRIGEITQEQARIRENMARLNASSTLYARYVQELDQQETELQQLRQQIASLKSEATKQQRELNQFLMSLDIE